MTLRMPSEDGQTFNTTDQLAADIKDCLPCKIEQGSLEAPVSITSAPAKASLGWNLDTEVALAKLLRNVKCLSEEENSYWNDSIARKLFPVPERSQEHKVF